MPVASFSLALEDALRSINIDPTSTHPMNRQQQENLLDLVDDAQSLFWSLLGRLERETGLELDGTVDFSGKSLNDLEAEECQECGSTVTRDDPFYSSPCGTFCSGCMRTHATLGEGCGDCCREFGYTPEIETAA